jgi:hypothetical protein
VAKQKRKPAKGKPITSHQLFPAVVALWFGALFGLGSLAVRPSLLEGLVLKSHLDLVIPAAAPPLGVTARILVALILAAIGAVIGIALARRIARPKPVVTERKRSSRDLGHNESAARPHYADASTRPPVLAGGNYSDEVDSPGGGGMLANRRRSLAIEHEEEAFVPHEMAPLPGGNPQVFDISELRMEEPQAVPEPATEAAPAAFAEPQPAPINLDWSNAAPLAAPAEPAAAPLGIEAQRQVFRAEPEPAQAESPQPMCPATEAAHADGRQVFGMNPPAPPSETPRQIFGMDVTGDHVDQDFVKAAGFKTTVFEQDAPEPLFGQRQPPAIPQAEAPLETAAPAPIPQAFEPVAAAEPVASPIAAEPEAPLPSPATLGITDLAARLAESMRRRRSARTQDAAPEVSEGEVLAPAAAPLEPAPVPLAFAAPVQAEPAPVPQSFEPVPVEALVQALATAPLPQAYEPPHETALAPFAAPQPPAFAAPEPMPAQAPEISAAIAAPPAAAPVPRAMQPLALDAFIEEDSALDPALLPRHIAMPVAPVPTTEPVAVAVTPAPAPLEPTPLELGAEDELPEEPGSAENYASLLEIAPARNPFVRIEEPAAASADIEPVVIFPGQAPVAAATPPLAPFAAVPEPAPFRRFDAPAAAGQGQPVAINSAPQAVEQGEAEQALRAALSNLQRISGAA